MPSILARNGRWRALVRRAGHTRCATFATRAAANAWAHTVERELDELKSTGVMQPRGLQLEDLIDRYTEQLYPLKPWGRTKTADLARLRKDLGKYAAGGLSTAILAKYFRGRHMEGAGGVVVSSQIGYLVGVLRTARTLWHLDVPLQAALDARSALLRTSLVARSRRRDRRVTDTEISALVELFATWKTTVPMGDIVQFAVATTMRVSEICRLSRRDLNKTARTIIIRNRRHPQDKAGNDQAVPLLDATGYDALAIIERQPKSADRIFPYNSRTVSAYFTSGVAELGLLDLHFQDLRHEGISRLFEARYRVEEIALLSGHRDWQELKRYALHGRCSRA